MLLVLTWRVLSQKLILTKAVLGSDIIDEEMNLSESEGSTAAPTSPPLFEEAKVQTTPLSPSFAVEETLGAIPVLEHANTETNNDNKVQDKTAQIQPALQSELDRTLYLPKIADPTGEEVKKRKLKSHEPNMNARARKRKTPAKPNFLGNFGYQVALSLRKKKRPRILSPVPASASSDTPVKAKNASSGKKLRSNERWSKEDQIDLMKQIKAIRNKNKGMTRSEFTPSYLTNEVWKEKSSLRINYTWTQIKDKIGNLKKAYINKMKMGNMEKDDEILETSKLMWGSSDSDHGSDNGEKRVYNSWLDNSTLMHSLQPFHDDYFDLVSLKREWPSVSRREREKIDELYKDMQDKENKAAELRSDLLIRVISIYRDYQNKRKKMQTKKSDKRKLPSGNGPGYRAQTVASKAKIVEKRH